MYSSTRIEVQYGIPCPNTYYNEVIISITPVVITPTITISTDPQEIRWYICYGVPTITPDSNNLQEQINDLQQTLNLCLIENTQLREELTVLNNFIDKNNLRSEYELTIEEHKIRKEIIGTLSH